jgi:hypothetical protein
VNRESIPLDALLDRRLADLPRGDLLGFPVGQHPSADVPAGDIDDRVKVEESPLGRAPQLRDLQGPDLVRIGGRQRRLGRDGMQVNYRNRN